MAPARDVEYTSPKRILVILRFLILGAVILLGTGAEDGSRPSWVFWFVATVYLVSNFIYALEAVEHFVSERVTSRIFLFDVILVTAMFGTSSISQDDFWIPYFLTILLAALAANLRVAVAAALVSAAVYGFVRFRSGQASIFDQRYFLHTAFYMATALFVGALAESAKRERARRGGIEQALDLSQRIADLFDLHRLIDLSRDPRGLARHILHLSQELFAGDAGSLMLVDEKSGELRVAVARGLDPVEGRADPEGIAAYILEHGEPLLLVGSLLRDPRFSHLEDRPEILSSIAVPIKYRDEIFGVLNFNRSNPHLPAFTPVDLQKASAFAVHVGVALANGKTFRELDEERMVTLDNLDDLRSSQAEAIRTERLQSLEEVVTSVARNLNNPLTGIQGTVAMAREKIPPGSALNQALDAILADANRCRDVVAQLQTVQRPPKPSRVPTDLVELVEGVLFEHDDALNRAGIALITEYDSGVHMVAVDRHMMSRVLAHLIDNAIEVMRARTDAIRKLTVGITTAGGVCEVSIRDSGAGVRLDHIQSIFQPFFSTGSARHAGLGLSTAQRLVRENGGSIQAMTDGVEGTTFIVRLPSFSVRQPRWGVDGKRQAPFAWPVGATGLSRRGGETGEPEAALLIDDDESVGRIVGEALEGSHVLEQATTVERAGEILRAVEASGEAAYGVVLLDLGIQGGYEFYRALHEEFPAQATRLVLLTAAAPPPEISRVIDQSRCPYLAKPFDVHDLRDAVLVVEG